MGKRLRHPAGRRRPVDTSRRGRAPFRLWRNPIVKSSISVLVLAAVLAVAAAPRVSRAYVAEGQPAPAFTKLQLDSPTVGTNTPRSLSDYSGKVIFLFMLGYN